MAFARDSKKTASRILNENTVIGSADDKASPFNLNEAITKLTHDVDLEGKKIDINQGQKKANTMATALRAMENSRKDRYGVFGASKVHPISAHSSAALILQQKKDDAALNQAQLDAYNELPVDMKDNMEIAKSDSKNEKAQKKPQKKAQAHTIPKNKTSRLELIGSEDVNRIVASYFASNPKTKVAADVKSVAAFVCTSKLTLLSSLIKQDVLEPILKKPVNELCQEVVYGNYNKVKSILDANPFLVLYKGKATDYSDRTIEGTAYQMALGADDVNRVKLDYVEDNPLLDAKGNMQILHADEGMAEMIQCYFIRALRVAENAQAEIEKQRKIQFPEGWEVKEEKRKQADKVALLKVVNAIKDAKVQFTNGTYWNSNNGKVQLDEQCKKALDEFQEYLKPKDTINQGKHFNVELLLEAFMSYNDANRYEEFGNELRSPKNVLMWRKVVGYIQRYLPACYAQAFCQNLYGVTHGDKLNRSFKIIGEYQSDKFYYPLNSNPGSYLGVDFAVGLHNRCDAAPLLQIEACLFGEFLSSKKFSLSTTYAAFRKSFKESLGRFLEEHITPSKYKP